MTARKPLVLVDGIATQLPPGDTLEANLTSGAIELINTSDRAQQVGTPVIFKAPNEFDAAQADSRATCEVVGMLATYANIGITAIVQGAGLITTLAETWQMVTENEQQLTPGAVYYLSTSTPGKITHTPPTTEGAFLVRLGKALNTTQFQVSIEPPIGL